MNVELIPTDILIQELLGRFDHAVFAGVTIRDVQDDKGYGDMVSIGGTRAILAPVKGSARGSSTISKPISMRGIGHAGMTRKYDSTA